MKKYAYILHGVVQYVEDRDVDLSHLIAPDLVDRFVEIPEGQVVTQNMVYSDGVFKENALLPLDVLTGYQNMVAEQNVIYTAAITVLAGAATTLTDSQAISMERFFPTWPDGVNAEGNYVQGQYVQHKGQLYRIEQATVKPIDSQPPDGVGMLAVYRPVDNTHAGTKEDPIPWVYGMDCFEGKYYSYEEAVYYCKGDMKPCVWYPDGGAPQWEKVA